MMDTSIEILKKRIEDLTPELAKAFIKIAESLETIPKSAVPQFQLDEVFHRIQFHSENPHTKLDFFENMKELEKNCA